MIIISFFVLSWSFFKRLSSDFNVECLSRHVQVTPRLLWGYPFSYICEDTPTMKPHFFRRYSNFKIFLIFSLYHIHNLFDLWITTRRLGISDCDVGGFFRILKCNIVSFSWFRYHIYNLFDLLSNKSTRLCYADSNFFFF